MSDQRGAASVTLDTIIAESLARSDYITAYESPEMGAKVWERELQENRDVWIAKRLPTARAVTDALLAKGEIRYLADGGTITRNKLREWHPPVICILPERKS